MFYDYEYVGKPFDRFAEKVWGKSILVAGIGLIWAEAGFWLAMGVTLVVAGLLRLQNQN